MRIKQRVNRLSVVLLPCWVLLVGLQPTARSQNPTDFENQWLIQAQVTTEDIIKGASNVKSYNRALLWARLGDIWWQSDKERARGFFLKAVEEAESKLTQEGAAISESRAATIRNLLAVIGARDSKLRARLMALLDTDSTNVARSGNNQNAHALLEAALAIVQENPRKAAALGSTSLRVGHSYLIEPLLFRLGVRDQTLANELFNEALATARATADNDLLFSLLVVAFPEAQTPPLRVPVPANQLRSAFLAVLAERLSRVPLSLEDEIEICKLATSTVPLLDKFSILLPQQSNFIRQRMTTCQSIVGTEARQYIESSLRGESFSRTVDDYLKAADRASNTKSRTNYFLQAVLLEQQQGKVDRAIALLDSMNNDERKAVGEVWEDLRWNLAVTAAYNHLKRGNYVDMQRTLAAVPTRLRPFTQIALARGLRGFKDKSIVLELIRDARSALSKSEMSDSNRIATYFWQGLIELYSTLAPDEAFEVFNESIKVLNHASSPSLPENSMPGGKSNNELLLPISLPEALLGTDGISVGQTISLIEDATVRSRFQLGLLRSLLQQYKSQQTPERSRNKSNE